MKNHIFRIILSLCTLMAVGQSATAANISQPLSEVKNISHPEPHRYGAGQPSPEAFSEFAKIGVKHVINLRAPEETPNLNEAAIVTKAGMAYYNIPISGTADLTRDTVALLDRILNQIGSEPVLIHCLSSNRVGAIMALRAAWIEGATIEEAIATGNRWGLTRMQPKVEQILQQ